MFNFLESYRDSHGIVHCYRYASDEEMEDVVHIL